MALNRYEILALKKAAIVLKAVADTMKDYSAKMETLVLVETVVKAANTLEEQSVKKGEL